MQEHPGTQEFSGFWCWFFPRWPVVMDKSHPASEHKDLKPDLPNARETLPVVQEHFKAQVIQMSLSQPSKMLWWKGKGRWYLLGTTPTLFTYYPYLSISYCHLCSLKKTVIINEGFTALAEEDNTQDTLELYKTSVFEKVENREGKRKAEWDLLPHSLSS